MGLFDAVSRDDRLTPQLALGGALVFTIAADGALDDDELVGLARVLRHEATFQAAARYASRHGFDEFLEAARGILDHAQRLCVFLNAVDLAMSSGALGALRQARLMRMMTAFELEEETLRPAIDVLAAKNDVAVLGL